MRVCGATAPNEPHPRCAVLRGVPKEEFASRDFYDVWLPELSPSQELVSAALRSETDREWTGFVRAYRREMSTPAARHLIELLAALSRRTDIAVGCYCEDANRCHRTALAEQLTDAGEARLSEHPTRQRRLDRPPAPAPPPEKKIDTPTRKPKSYQPPVLSTS